jgi:hypothetical protein
MNRIVIKVLQTVKHEAIRPHSSCTPTTFNKAIMSSQLAHSCYKMVVFGIEPGTYRSLGGYVNHYTITFYKFVMH